MYAVIENGGKQYRVAPGDTVDFETLEGEVGSKVDLGKVLAIVDGESVTAGNAAGAAKVTGTITLNDRGKKTLVFKFKRKKQYKRTIGHRQNFTRVTIDEISA
jgi:large subunit ribosomal protein L21